MQISGACHKETAGRIIPGPDIYIVLRELPQKGIGELAGMVFLENIKMRTLILFIATIYFFSFAQAQKDNIQAEHVMKTEDGNLSVVAQKNGKYLFIYQNGMSDKTDERNIVFVNKQEIRSFEKKISRALTAKDGTSDLIIYKVYRIRLLTEIGGVFMIVNETGKSQSTLRISKEMYQQVNTL